MSRKSVPDDIDPFVRKSELRRFISPDLTEMETRIMSAFDALAREVEETQTLVAALRAELAGFAGIAAKLAELEGKLVAAEAAANAAADALDRIQNGPGGSMGGFNE